MLRGSMVVTRASVARLAPCPAGPAVVCRRGLSGVAADFEPWAAAGAQYSELDLTHSPASGVL